MRRVRFQDEAEKRNVSIEAITNTYENLLKEGNLHGIIDAKNGEFIHYTSQEIDELVKLLDSKRILMTELAKKYDLKSEQARLIIDKLLENGRITGTFSQDGAFISDMVLRNMVIEVSKESTSIDIPEISHKLSVPEGEVRLVLEDLGELVVNATLPYRQIRFADLSHETNLPENLIIALLKTLISEGKVSGSLDLVDGALVREIPTSEEIEARPSPKPTITTNQAIVIGVVIIIVLAIFLVPTIMRSATPKIQTVIIEINYSGEWHGSIGDLRGSYSVQGYGYKEYTFHREGQDPWIVTAVIQKMETYGTLTVSIVTTDDEVLESQSTSAEYGVATVSWTG